MALVAQDATSQYVSEHVLNGGKPTAVFQAAVARNPTLVHSELMRTFERHFEQSAEFQVKMRAATRVVLDLAGSGCLMKDDKASFEAALTNAFEMLVQEMPKSLTEADGGPFAYRNFMRHFSNVFLHVEALELLGIVHAECFADVVPKIGFYGGALLLAVRGYFYLNTFFLTDPNFEVIAEDFYAVLLGHGAPELASWEGYVESGPEAKLVKPDVFVIESAYVRVLRKQPYVFQLIPGVAKSPLSDPDKLTCPGEGMNLAEWKKFTTANNKKTLSKSLEAPRNIHGVKNLNWGDVAKFYSVIDEHVANLATPFSPGSSFDKKVWSDSGRYLRGWYSAVQAARDFGKEQATKKQLWKSVYPSYPKAAKLAEEARLKLTARPIVRRPGQTVNDFMMQWMFDAVRIGTKLSYKHAETVVGPAQSSGQETRSEEVVVTVADDSRQLLEESEDGSLFLYGREYKPQLMRGRWVCKGTVVYYEPDARDTPSQSYGRCREAPYGWYTEMCSNVARKCTDSGVTSKVDDHFPFGHTPGTCEWRHRAAAIFDFGDYNEHRVPTSIFPNFGGVVSVSTDWQWDGDRLMEGVVGPDGSTRGVGKILVVAGSPPNWWVGLERMEKSKWRWIVRGATIGEGRVVVSEVFSVGRGSSVFGVGAPVKRLQIQVMGSNIVLVDGDSGRELVNVYFIGQELRAAVGKVVPWEYGKISSAGAGSQRRLVETSRVPKHKGKLGSDKDGVVFIGPMFKLNGEFDQFVGGMEGVDTPIWLPLTVGVEHVGVTPTLMKTEKRFTKGDAKLDLMVDKEKRRPDLPKINRAFLIKLVKAGQYGEGMGLDDRAAETWLSRHGRGRLATRTETNTGLDQTTVAVNAQAQLAEEVQDDTAIGDSQSDANDDVDAADVVTAEASGPEEVEEFVVGSGHDYEVVEEQVEVEGGEEVEVLADDSQADLYILEEVEEPSMHPYRARLRGAVRRDYPETVQDNRNEIALVESQPIVAEDTQIVEQSTTADADADDNVDSFQPAELPVADTQEAGLDANRYIQEAGEDFSVADLDLLLA